MEGQMGWSGHNLAKVSPGAPGKTRVNVEAPLHKAERQGKGKRSRTGRFGEGTMWGQLLTRHTVPSEWWVRVGCWLVQVSVGGPGMSVC